MQRSLFVISTTLLLFCGSLCAQLRSDNTTFWRGVIELPNDALSRHVLHDLPGSVIMLRPEGQKITPFLFGDKVLKDANKLPELIAQPTVHISQIFKKNTVASIKVLSFVSLGMEETDEVEFHVTETSHASIYDNEIDWPALNSRVSNIRTANPNLPAGTLFGVVRVASVIMISYKTYAKVQRKRDVKGWGFIGAKGHYLSEKSEQNNVFKVGVSVIFPDAIMTTFQSNWPGRSEDKSNLELQNTLEDSFILSLSKKLSAVRFVLPENQVIF